MLERYSVIYSPSHKLWFVYDRKLGQYVEHSVTKAGAERMATQRNQQ
jgi:hypothetical protein